MAEAACRTSEAEELNLVREALATDFPFYAEECLVIRSKTGDLVPFRLNKIQQKLDAIADEELARTGMVRILLLKGRQGGGSTYVEGRFFWRVTNGFGRRALILAHEDKATGNLFGMAKRFYDHCPLPVRPAIKASNAKELDFRHLDGGYRVATANTPDSGRSDTVQYFHASEAAFWKHGKRILSGALQAVPDAPDTEAWIESTANGYGNTFQQLWTRAEKAWAGEIDPETGNRYESQFRPVFVPWFWSDEYRRPVPPEFARTGAEREMADLYDLDDEQLQFRRERIAAFHGDIDLFRQEYPCCAAEAFILSGRPVFPAGRLHKLTTAARPAPHRGELKASADRVKFAEYEEGSVEIWEHPRPGLHYAVGVDVAEGKEGGDTSVIQVLKRGPIVRQVARVVPPVEADDLALVAVNMALLYNSAWLGIERNGLGLATVLAAIKTGYSFLYKMVDAKTGKAGPIVGWETTTSSRPLMVSDCVGGIRDGSLDIRSPETVGQMRTFVRDAQGKPQAQEGELDDDVMALCIAYQVALLTEPTTTSSGTTDLAKRLLRKVPKRTGWSG